MQQWRSSCHAHRILALQAFALDTANPAEAALAIQMVQVCMPCSASHASGRKGNYPGRLCAGIMMSLMMCPEALLVDVCRKQIKEV